MRVEGGQRIASFCLVEWNAERRRKIEVGRALLLLPATNENG
jgi:hypothetical protein